MIKNQNQETFSSNWYYFHLKDRVTGDVRVRRSDKRSIVNFLETLKGANVHGERARQRATNITISKSMFLANRVQN